MNGLPDKMLFRVDEVADILSVSTRTIYRMIDDDEISVVRIRGSVRISRQVIIPLIHEKD